MKRTSLSRSEIRPAAGERYQPRTRSWPPLQETTIVSLDPARWSTRERQVAFWCLCEAWLAQETVH